MRMLARGLVVCELLTAALVGACADPPPPPASSVVPVACVASASNPNGDAWALPWELEVSPTPIKSGEPFAATFDGTAVFPDWYLELGLRFFPPPVTEGILVDLKATVRVRHGATQTSRDVVLVPDSEEYPYRCSVGRKLCNQENDLDGGGNTDCEPVEADNPCVRFVDLPISGQCDPGGLCDDLGRAGQCKRVGFCVTEADFRIELEAIGGTDNMGIGSYTANEEGDVLFGFDDTHVEQRDGGVNDETWLIPIPDYDDPIGPVAIRATFLNIDVAWECAMGINCHDPIFGVDCSGKHTSPAPDEALISFPIETEAP